MKSIAVVGGNGFLGRKICEVGIRRGWAVTSLSRSGSPPKAIGHSDHSWISQVKWEKADLMDPASYKDKLGGKSAVVHSVGILFENMDYKTTLNLNFNFLNDMQKLANMAKGPNPMARDASTSYEAVQRDLAVMLADAFLEEGGSDPAFVYISADEKPPVIPDGYIITKREAEFELSCKKGLRSIFMRPSFMYDASEPVSNNRVLLSKLVGLGYNMKEAVFSDKVGILNKLMRPPASTEQVAVAMYNRLEDPSFSGVVSVEEIVQN